MDDHLLAQRLSIIDGKVRNDKQGKNIFLEVITIKGEPREVRRLYVEHENGFRGVGWIIDDDISECMVCSKEFGFFVRKHHCRSCGNLVCHSCSPHEVTIYELSDMGPQRVCIQCFWGQDPVYVSHTRSWDDDDDDDDFDEDDYVLQSRIHAELNSLEKTFHFVIANLNTDYAFNGPIILIQNAPWKLIEAAITRQFDLPFEIAIKAMQLMSKEGEEESPLLDTSILFWQYAGNYSPLLSNYFVVYLSKQQTRQLKEAMISRMRAEDAMYSDRLTLTEQDEPTAIVLRSSESNNHTPVKQQTPRPTDSLSAKDLEFDSSTSFLSPTSTESSVAAGGLGDAYFENFCENTSNTAAHVAIEDSLLELVHDAIDIHVDEVTSASLDVMLDSELETSIYSAVHAANESMLEDSSNDAVDVMLGNMADNVVSELSQESVDEYVVETVEAAANSLVDKVMEDEIVSSAATGVEFLVSEQTAAASEEALLLCVESTLDGCFHAAIEEVTTKSAEERSENLISQYAEEATDSVINTFIDSIAADTADYVSNEKTDVSVDSSECTLHEESIETAIEDAIASCLDETSEDAVEAFVEQELEDEVYARFAITLDNCIEEIVESSVATGEDTSMESIVNEFVAEAVSEITDSAAALDSAVEIIVEECLAAAQEEFAEESRVNLLEDANIHDTSKPAQETTSVPKRRSSWLQLSDEDRMLLSLATRRSTVDADVIDGVKNADSEAEVRRPSIADASRFRDSQRLMSDETLLKLAQQPFYHFPLVDPVHEDMVIKNNDPFSNTMNDKERLSDINEREASAASTILTLRELHYQALQTAFKNIAQDSGFVTLAQLLSWEDINHVVEQGVLSIVDIDRVYTRVHARKDLSNTESGLSLEGFCEFMERLEALAEEGLVEEEAKAAAPESKAVKRASYVSSMSLDSIGEMLGLGNGNIMAQVADAFHGLVELQNDSTTEISFETLCKWDALRYAIKENIISVEHIKSIFDETITGKDKSTLNLEEFSVLSLQLQKLIDASEIESAVERLPESRESVIGDMEVVIQGELFKQGQKVKSWKKRLCIVRGCRLSYFDGTKLKGEFSFRGGSVDRGDDKVVGRPFSMLLRGSGASTGRVLVLCASSEEDRLRWLEALQIQIDRYDMRVTETVVTRDTTVELPTEAVAATGISEWGRYLDETEHVIMNGEITKRNKYGLAQKRQLLLTTAPRLIYIDEVAKAIKGEIQLKQIQVELVNATIFKVTSEGRTYRLVCSEPQAEEWTRALKSIS